jgi:hypothetical protein
LSELSDCTDGFDNDADGLADYPEDPSCSSPSGPSEQTACSDGIDNDRDGWTDWVSSSSGDWTGCTGPEDDSEFGLGSGAYQCDDGFDNDGDGKTDYRTDVSTTDPQCDAPSDAEADGCGLLGIEGLAVLAFARAGRSTHWRKTGQRDAANP